MNQIVPTGSNVPATVPKPELRSGGSVGAIVPQDAEQAFRMAKLIHASGMAPRDMQTPEKLVTAIFHGLEVGLKPLQAVQSIAVVNGRPTIWGDGALGLVLGSGLVEDFGERLEGEGDKMVAFCTARRIGFSTPIERRFSVDDAKKAKLWGKAGPWQDYPRRMLQMRARSWCLRDGFADVLRGLAVREEVEDVAPARPMQLQDMPAAAPITAAALIAQARPDDADEDGVIADAGTEPKLDTPTNDETFLRAYVRDLQAVTTKADLDALTAKHGDRVLALPADLAQQAMDVGKAAKERVSGGTLV